MNAAQRIDKWLWFARFFKTRALAAKIAGAGRVRLNGHSVTKPSQAVRFGDVLTFLQGPHVRVVKVVATGARRGPAPEARALYEDLEPPRPKAVIETPVANRPRRRGRPTKRDGRAITRFTGDG